MAAAPELRAVGLPDELEVDSRKRFRGSVRRRMSHLRAQAGRLHGTMLGLATHTLGFRS